MSGRRYRVIQWASGAVGKAAIRHFTENDTFDLVGLLVHDPAKDGRDAGEIAGLAPIGVQATSDVDEMIALPADCVHYAPRQADLDVICRLLRSGKNVVTPSCHYYPIDMFRDEVEQIEAACRDGGVSFHGVGIHPGFAGDILPLTLARMMSRIDRIDVHEVVDMSADTSWSWHLGFGDDPADLLANPRRGDAVAWIFAQSMAMLVEGLGKTMERLTTTFEVAAATRDLDVAIGRIPAGSVAGMHFEWTAWADGQPLVVFHQYWTMGRDIQPDWGMHGHFYRIELAGEPPTRIDLQATAAHPSGDAGHWGLVWTAMLGVNAIPQVCEAPPGYVTNLDLGLVRPRGLVHPR